MKTATITAPFLLAFLVAGCGGDFTELGTQAGRGGNGATAGVGGNGATGGKGSGGTQGSGATGNTGALGGNGATGGSAECTKDTDCPKSLVACQLCADGSSACPWAHCDAGQCTAGIDTCPATECKVDDDCPKSKALCQLCADGSSACPWAHCDAGQCTAGIDTCPATECKVDGDCPKSQAPCQLCADGSSACPWAHCNAGQCTAGIDTCPAPTDPCAGKACGDVCTTCTNGQGCLTVVMYCDANLTCQVSQPVCAKTSCTADTDCAPDNNICVDQIGGPGPAQGFECATRQPCGSADPCACILNEGTCTHVTVDGTPGYCQCDNGLD
ncbi:MAG TPA: hypothetical protein VLJ38_21275 [Polyangiaceae bacterium]|nr:hypothetical protein [Polyangiaceae bacterium]